jgi:O-methyltransferase
MNRSFAPIRDLLDRVRIQPSTNERIHYWVYGPLFRRWCETHPCEVVVGRYELYRRLVESEGLDGPIDYLEFGVSRGDSVRWWVEANRHPETTFVGFDSFEGLPEAWAGWPEGAFSADGEMPSIADERCQFVKGLFHDTLPNWLMAHEFSRRTVLHLDADLYTSTLLVLTQLLPKLKADSILIFDEFDDPLHEYRALHDAMGAYRRDFVPLCRTERWTATALKAT